MPDEPEDEAVKKFQLELDNFGKRTKKGVHVIGDLTLCMRTCNTPDVRLTLSEATRRAMAELERERATLENKIKKDLALAAKKAEKAEKAKKGKIPPGKGAKPPDIAGKQKSTKLKLKLMVDKFNKKHLPSDHSVWLELSAKPMNTAPFVDHKKTSLILRYGIKF